MTTTSATKDLEYVFRDLIIKAGESLWHFLEKRANRFQHIKW
jgi:hypothetical protein